MAAIWLDNKDYVAQRIREGTVIVSNRPVKIQISSVFGDCFDTAVMRGNARMWELLLSAVEEKDRIRGQIRVLDRVVKYGRGEMFETSFRYHLVTKPRVTSRVTAMQAMDATKSPD